MIIKTRGKNRGTPLTYRSVRSLFERLSKKAGFAVTAHMLRHTHATELILNGWDSAHVQKRLGHAHVQTTLDIYTHLQSKDLKIAFERYQTTKNKRENK